MLAGLVGALLLSPTTALAAGPHGTGIAPEVADEVNEEELGYAAKYEAWKEAAALALMDGGGGAGIQPNMPEPPGGGYPASFVLDFTIFHQKAGNWCLPAVGQSILHHRFGGFTTPSIAEKQQDIANLMGTGAKGTPNSSAFAWINAKFETLGDAWQYTKYRSTDFATFKIHGMYDVYAAELPMYVRVDLHSNHYLWYDSDPTPHATLLVGYTHDGNRALSADPYAKTKADGTCNTYPYSTGPDYGCIWGSATSGRFDMIDYFLALDLNTDNGKSEWW